MEIHDDDLSQFEAEGAAPLSDTNEQGHVEHDRLQIWYAAYGSGRAVILLHGGLGNSGNWGYQVPALVENGYRVIVIDSRGHGRSTRDEKPYSYELMAADVLVVMDTLRLEKAAFSAGVMAPVRPWSLRRNSPNVRQVCFSLPVLWTPVEPRNLNLHLSSGAVSTGI